VAFAERHLASTLFAPGRNTIRAVLVYRGQTIATSNSITVEGGAEDKMPAEKEFKENSKGTSREFKGDIQNIR
jgi:hypothetical protein